MSRVALHLAFLLCLASLLARAGDGPSQPRSVAAPAHKTSPKKPAQLKQKDAKAGSAHSAILPIVGDLTAGSRDRPSLDAGGSKKGAGGDGAWSVNPQWDATNGGSTVPYGSRALFNELQSNPSEATGYGAGAKADFHF